MTAPPTLIRAPRGRWRHAVRLMRAALVTVALLLALAVPLSVPVMAQQGGSEDDAGFLARTLQDLLSDAGREVRIRGFQGALSSRARIAEMSIADDDGVWLTLRDVVLDWNRAALLDRRVAINELGAGEIILHRRPGASPDAPLPSATAREPFRLPELPVSVVIGQLRADRVVIGAPVFGQSAELALEGAMRLVTGQGDASFLARRIDGQEGQFRFTGAFDNETRRLALDLDLTEAEGGIAATLLGIPDVPALSLTVAGDDPIETFSAAINLSTDGTERVTGAVTLLDTTPEERLLDGLQFALDIGGDLRPLLTPDLHPLVGDDSRLRAQGARSEEGAVSLYELTLRTRTAQVVGRADLSPQMVPELVDLFVRIDDPEGAMVPLPGSDARLRRAELVLDYDIAVSPDWSVMAEIQALDAPGLQAETIALDARGLFRTNGGGENAGEGTAGEGPTFDGTFDFVAQGLRADDPALQEALGDTLSGFMAVNWQSGAPVQISGLALEARHATLTAAGVLDGLTFDGFVEGEIPSLTPFSALAGRSLAGHVLAVSRGEVDALTRAFDLDLSLNTRDLRIDQDEFDNLVAGEAAITVQIARDVQGTTLRALQLSAGALELSGRGHFRPQDTALALRFASGDLGALGAGYGGRIDLAADFASDGSTDRLVLDGSLRDLSPGPVGGADILRGLLAGETTLRGEATRRDGLVSVAGVSLDGPRLALGLSGTWSRDESDLTLALERLVLDSVAPQLAGRLQGQLRLQGQTLARSVTLDLASTGALRTGVAQLDGLLTQGVRLRGEAREDGRDAFVIDTLDLTANGMSARLSGRQGADGAGRFALSARLNDLARVQPGFSGPVSLRADLTRAAGQDDYALDLTLDGPSALQARAEGRVRGGGRLALRLTGSVDAAIANPQIEPSTVQGLARFDLRIDGPPALQSVRGTVRAEGARFVRPNVNLSLQDIALEADVNGAMVQLRMDGRVTRGGRLSAQGSLFLDGDRDADLTLTADRIALYQPRLFEGRLSGTARLMGPLARGALVSGQLTVNSAEIRIPNAPLARAGFIPEGLTHVGESAAARRTRVNAGILTGTRTGGDGGVPLRLDLTLDAPGRVFVRGRGLDAELGGSLRLAGTTRDVIPSGGFSLIRGRLDLLGNRFALTEGSASMVGDFVPFVRLVATTDSDGVTTSIILEGEADAPTIRFTSSPELPQDEVLARLIFRRSLTSLSPFQAAQLALSVATLTGFGEDSVLSRTRQALGLDDLDLTTDADGTTAVRAGRYIGERVYSDVAVDSEGRGEVSINLDLTPSVTLRARTDTRGRTGLGVFFERDY